VTDNDRRMRASTRQWPGMRSEYFWALDGADGTRTRPHQVGVSFSAHRETVFESGGRVTTADIPGGSVVVTGAEPLTWLRAPEATEALEIYPEASPFAPGESPRWGVESAAVLRDGTVLGIASVLKRVHAVGAELSDIAASTLAHRLAAHLSRHYGEHRDDAPPCGALDRARVDRVAEYVEANLGAAITLDQLAAVAALSPYHFARMFRRATGLAPHQFVTSRRVDRATRLLLGREPSVTAIAAEVGMPNASHFRRVFRRHIGLLPGQLRAAAREQDPT
jgi:AraC family transcriptional regulator